MHSDVSAVVSLILHLWMAPLTLGAIAVALLGPLPYVLVIIILEVSRFGIIGGFGALNASYIVQFITILNQSWINKFEDQGVIWTSVVCSLLHYVIYVPELIMVSFICRVL